MFSEHDLYVKGVKSIADETVSGELDGSTILLTGATGLVGRVMVDAIMYRNTHHNAGISIIAVTSNEIHAKKRFKDYLDDPLFKLMEWDISSETAPKVEKVDYIIHGASNTHPAAYATKPIDTIQINVQGTNSVLEMAVRTKAKKVLLMSTVEVYGENRGDVERFEEGYSGYINPNTLRAGYPESKRVAEALCQAYIQEFGLNVVIARLGRVIGPTVLETDSKSTSQFMKDAVAGQDIILKSSGSQQYSMIYTPDACRAILYILLHGECGEAYNVATDEVISLKDAAKLIAQSAGVVVRSEAPTDIESRGFSVVSKALMDCEKLKHLGWASKFSLREGIESTLAILKGEKI